MFGGKKTVTKIARGPAVQPKTSTKGLTVWRRPNGEKVVFLNGFGSLRRIRQTVVALTIFAAVTGFMAFMIFIGLLKAEYVQDTNSDLLKVFAWIFGPLVALTVVRLFLDADYFTLRQDGIVVSTVSKGEIAFDDVKTVYISKDLTKNGVCITLSSPGNSGVVVTSAQDYDVLENAKAMIERAILEYRAAAPGSGRD